MEVVWRRREKGLKGEQEARGGEQNCGLSETAEDKVERSRTISWERMETIKLTGGEAKRDASLREISGLAISSRTLLVGVNRLPIVNKCSIHRF